MSEANIRRSRPSGQEIRSVTGEMLGVKVFKKVWVEAECDACSQTFWHCKNFRKGVYCSSGCRRRKQQNDKE